jgi:hypothetical protein
MAVTCPWSVKKKVYHTDCYTPYKEVSYGCHMPLVCEEEGLPYCYTPSKEVSYGCHMPLVCKEEVLTYWLLYTIQRGKSLKVWFGFMVFNATFNNISFISWRSVLLVEVTRENHRPVVSHWQNLSHLSLKESN